VTPGCHVWGARNANGFQACPLCDAVCKRDRAGKIEVYASALARRLESGERS
jgi:hypothetical protein